MTSPEQQQQQADDRERGYRFHHNCADCGAPMYQFFDRATRSWSERAGHMGMGCIGHLRRRIEELEKERGEMTQAEQIKMLREELRSLEAWKAEQLAVESEWDPQAVGRALELRIGTSIRSQILPGILALTQQRDEVRSSLQSLRRYVAAEGLPDGDKLLVGLVSGSIWGPCADPTYNMYELAESVEKWLHSELDKRIDVLSPARTAELISMGSSGKEHRACNPEVDGGGYAHGAIPHPQSDSLDWSAALGRPEAAR